MKTRKIGLNRGKARLWLEGAILADAGFTRGLGFRIEKTDNPLSLIITADTKGTRHIAGTIQRPIIDINSGALLAGFIGTVAILNPAPGVLVVMQMED